MINDCISTRKKIIERAKKEMLGPGSEDIGGDIRCEIISDSPTDRYSLGILFPQNNIYGQDDTEKQKNLEEVEEDENLEYDEEYEDKIEADTNSKKESSVPRENESIDEEISMTNQNMPSAMGMTCFVKGNTDKLVVEISCAKYRASKFKDCAVKIESEINIEEYLLSEYVYEESGYLKLKKNITSKNVTDMVSERKIENERPDIVAALYKLASLCTSENYPKHTGYVRVPFLENRKIEINTTEELSNIYINEDGELSQNEGCLKLTVLTKKYSEDIFSYTVVLINEYKAKCRYDKCFFQPEIRIDTNENEFIFIEKSDIDKNYNRYMEDSELVFNLLYRNKKSYAVGHGVATGQNVDINNGTGQVFTDFFPSYEIPQLDFEIDGIGEESIEILSMFNMSDLSNLTKDDKLELLNKFVAAYKNWIDEQKKLGIELKKVYKPDIVDNLIENCEGSLKRIRTGISILENNNRMYESFMLMNRAMLMQRAHSKFTGSEYDRFPGDKQKPVIEIDYLNIQKKDASWRAFQLAFILMNIESVSNPESTERDIVDLIWIPTGGGKTEAYLGLTGFIIFLRRLNDPVNGGGTAIIMRYTLRLLASQQFIRAAILICACEKMRRELNKSGKYNLGSDEISIGLWVGGDPTPNTNEKAKEEYKKLTKAFKSRSELDENKREHNKFQVLKCPWCGTKLEMEYVDGKKKGIWGYEYSKKNIIFCPEPKCDFNKKLPIQVVDEELYKNPPTLLFGTVDKFASLPWKGEVANLFALNKDNNTKSPELIIQDELHLISGPLGTIVGLYETAVDAMCSKKGIKPKIIASTATIKRAEEQCRMLFNRKVMQFPPSGLNIEDNFFSHEVSTEDRPGRMYVGLMASGKTTTTAQIRLYTALIESLNLIDISDDIKDKYWTLVGYFNSVRELAKTTTLVSDDIASNIKRYMKRIMKIYSTRSVYNPKELTSRLSSTEIVKTLKELENEYNTAEIEGKKISNINHAIDVLLATNMISVGVDVSRLNLMVASGQPKQTSEYIQATSRVGRRYPGLVFTLYNASKTRDRSHYELFYSYHQTFYKYVEPTSITPFSEPARERALHAVFISMVRHIIGLNTEDEAKNFHVNIDGLEEVKNYIISRANDLDNSQNKNMAEDTEKELDEIIYKWITKIETASFDEKVNYYKKNADKNLLVAFQDKINTNAFPTMQSMRNIDSQARAEIIILGDKDNEGN
ncbi:helicase-related protein [Clostridium butyricum]